jgi:hypothetical protein
MNASAALRALLSQHRPFGILYLKFLKGHLINIHFQTFLLSSLIVTYDNINSPTIFSSKLSIHMSENQNCSLKICRHQTFPGDTLQSTSLCHNHSILYCYKGDVKFQLKEDHMVAISSIDEASKRN